MGHKDNPRRQIRNVLVAGGIGALLLAGGGYEGYTIHQQNKVISEYQHKLVEQGSLIDQQKKDLSNQNKEISKLHIQIDDLNSQLGNDKKNEESYKQEIQNLKDELAFKRADEARKRDVEAALNGLPSQGGPSKGRTVTVEATGYIAKCTEGCTGTTATGYDLASHPHAKVIAVDPNVIPLGSEVYVPGYGYAIAADTGGGIDGHEIDVHFPNTSAALEWGRRTVDIIIVN